MRRKLVKHGEATLMISLPSKWLKNNNLGKGDELEVEEADNTIILKSEKSFQNKNKVKIDVSGFSPIINRIILSLYLRGTDELEIKFSNPEDIRDLQKRVIGELIGFEIIKQSHDSLVIRDITGVDNQNTDELIKRVFFILDSMAEELLMALEKSKNFEPVIETDKAVNKFVNFCLRLFNKKGYKDFSKTSQVYAIVSLLEDIGDSYKRIAKDINKIKIKKEYLSVIRDIKIQLKLFENIFFNYNKKDIIDLAKRYELIKDKIKKIEQKTLIDFHLFTLNETIIKMNNYLLTYINFSS